MSQSFESSPLLNPARVPQPEKFVQNVGTFSLDGSAPVAVRPLEAAPPSVLGFSQISRPETIRSLTHRHVPGWSAFSQDKIAIDQICEGLSNQLFKVHVESDANGVVPCVLFRIYGTEASTLYDQEQELVIYQTLSKYQIAPRMYAHGEGWRIEEWHFAVPLKTRYMRNPSILGQVASQLGRFHKLALRADFPRQILDLPPASVLRTGLWSDNAQKAAGKLKNKGCAEWQRRVPNLPVEDMVAEREWLREFVVEGDQKLKGSGLDIVLSHNDVQENNILQTHYGLRFIDFEYSSMDYQAMDIANYFCECCIDYTHDKYPFYMYTHSDFPTEWEQRLVCAIYLSEYLEAQVKLDDPAVTLLMDRVHRFTLMSHYLWAVWSIIRAPQVCTFNEFDFLAYSQMRWDAYKRAKRTLLEAQQKKEKSKGRADDHRSSVAPRQKKEANPYLMGGVLTAGGVLVGSIAAAVLLTRLARQS